MDKIEFKNNQEPAINATNLNALQDNVDNAKQDKMISGTWDPIIATLGSGTPSVEYLIKKGNYKRIGNLVYVDFYLKGRITALGGSTKYGIVWGLPYSAASNNANFGNIVWSGMTFNLIESNEPILLMPIPSEKTLRIQIGRGSAAAELKITPGSGAENYFEIGGNGWYLTDET